MLSRYIEARVKHIIGNSSPVNYPWNEIDLKETSLKQLKKDLEESLGKAIDKYALTTRASDVVQKCLLFRQKPQLGESQHSYIMLEYTKQKKSNC